MKKIIRGAILYANLDPVTGSEEKGCRPVLIVQNDVGNRFSPTTMIAPISTKSYKGKTLPTHVEIKQFKKIRPNSIIMLEQVRTIDKSRFKGYVDMLNKEQMMAVDNALLVSLGLERKLTKGKEKCRKTK